MFVHRGCRKSSEKLLSRRNAIKSIAGASSWLMLAPPMTRASQRRRYSPRFGIKYSMIRVGKTPEEKLRVAKASGVDGVEISMAQRAFAGRIRRESEKLELPIHGVICPDKSMHMQAIDLCEAVGGNAVLVIAEEKSGVSYRENYALSQAIFRRLVSRAERKNIQLLVENVRASFLKEAEEMARFIDELDSPFVGAYFDTGNAITWTRQSAEYWGDVLSHRIKKVDVKDRGHSVFGDPRLRKLSSVGTDGGEVHWENVRRSLAKINFRGWATAEVAGGDGERLKAINLWMRKVLRKPTA